jgi:hypothetical protein
LEKRFGALKIAFNTPREKFTLSIGYPFEYGFREGKFPVVSDGKTTLGHDRFIPNTNKIPSEMK